MITEHWSIRDPDGILCQIADDVILMESNGFACKKVIPREDLFQAEHKITGVIIDLGFYGDVLSEGVWILNVIGPDLDWEAPVYKAEFYSVCEAVKVLQAREPLNKSALAQRALEKR